MKRITEPLFIVDDLMPGIEYLFRVMASNQIGLSKPSTESDQMKMARTSMESDFLQEPFENRYQLMEEISRCVLLEEGVLSAPPSEDLVAAVRACHLRPDGSMSGDEM